MLRLDDFRTHEKNGIHYRCGKVRPFGFQLAGVVVNDSKTREAITKEQMRKFLKFVHDDNTYCKYFEAVFILFHTGMNPKTLQYLMGHSDISVNLNTYTHVKIRDAENEISRVTKKANGKTE